MLDNDKRRSRAMNSGADILNFKGDDHQTAKAAAVEWQIKLLSGETLPAEISDFKTWLKARPENAEAYARLTDMWDGMEPLANSDFVQECLNTSRRHNADSTAISYLKSFWVAVQRLLSPRRAAAISGLAIAAIIIINISGPDGEVYRTALGEQRTIQLADGSTVILNTSTTINVSYFDDERRISLLEGQASFDVAPDTQRPFIVDIGDGFVRALGTQFDVYRSSEAVTVTLIEGKVEVTSTPPRSVGAKLLKRTSSPEASFRAKLSPGEQVAIAAAGPISRIAEVDVDRVVAWREGKVNFRNTPLAEAVADMNRYSSTKIIIAEKDLEGLRVSGVFRVGNSDHFVNALQSLFDVRAERRADNEIVLLSIVSG
jgi:transmembrane sensor